MGLSFSDLDNDLARSVFSATAIVDLLLLISLSRIVHFVLIGLCTFFVGFMAFKLFLKPLIDKGRSKRKGK